jgi:uncharacterized caspase-like protein
MTRRTAVGCIALIGQASAFTHAAEVNGSAYTIAVGIDDYARTNRVWRLRYAAQDAEAFANVMFKRGHRADRTHLLLNKYATVMTIRVALRKVLLSVAGPADQVFLFFSGIGIARPGWSEGYILGYDSMPEKLESTAISLSEVRQLVASTMARRVVVFADLCRASYDSGVVSNRINLRMMELSNSRAVAGILASRSDQPSFENAEYRHGVFTYALVNALDRVSAPQVRLRDLSEAVMQSVMLSTDRKQRPVFFGDPQLTVGW